MQGLALEVVVFPAGSVACRNLPLGVPPVWLVRLRFGVMGLKPIIGCVGSWPTWVGFGYRSLSDVVCNCPLATCLELSHSLLFLSASTGPGCACEGPTFVTGWLPSA